MIKKSEYKKLAYRMINACKRLHMRGILSGVGGNISVRTSLPEIILCSPTGIPIMDMFPGDICAVDISDIKNYKYNMLKAKHRPTSEILLHGGIYSMRPEINAVLHTHPPVTTAFSCTTHRINYRIQEDQRWYIGDVSYIPFIYSSSKALAEGALPERHIEEPWYSCTWGQPGGSCVDHRADGGPL
jgi:L-fuculose-phosphate aldolase